MFDFHYCIDLQIVHPSIDPKVITREITSLRPRKEVMAGTERVLNGKRLGRNAKLSVWSAPLHEPDLLYSETEPISEFIVGALQNLQSHRALFRRLGEDGAVFLQIGWWADSNASAALLDAAAIQACGDLGIGIELNFYAGDEEV